MGNIGHCLLFEVVDGPDHEPVLDLEQAEEIVVIVLAALGLLRWRCGRARETEAHQLSRPEAVRTPSDESLHGGQTIYVSCCIDGFPTKMP